MVIALNGDKSMFYDIVGVKEKEAAQLNRSEPAGVESTSFINSISQNAENVNSEVLKGKKFALPDTDSDGNALSNEQREYFSTSKITDAEGRLLFLYHGSNAYEEIHVFRCGKNGYLGGIAIKIADFMIEHTVLTDMYADSTDVSEALRAPSGLRGRRKERGKQTIGRGKEGGKQFRLQDIKNPPSGGFFKTRRSIRNLRFA